MREAKIESAAREAIREGFAPAIIRVVGPTLDGDLTTPAVVEASRSMAADSPLLLAGVSKLLTRAAVLAAVHRGRLSLDAPIMPLVPEEVHDGLLTHPGLDDLTVRQALVHRTGFADAFTEGKRPLGDRLADDDFAYSLEELAHWTSGMKPHRKRGTHRADLNAHLLGAALERTLDLDYEAALRELVLEPLELDATHLLRETEPVPAMSSRSMVLYRPKFTRSSGPAGGVISTAADMDRFLRGFYTGELVPTEFLESLPAASALHPAVDQLRVGAPGLELGSGRDALRGGSGAPGSFAFWSAKAQATIVGTLGKLGAEEEALKLVRKLAKAL